jgi:hypothetical protein
LRVQLPVGDVMLPCGRTITTTFHKISFRTVNNFVRTAFCTRPYPSALDRDLEMAASSPEQHNFPKEEEKILELWKKLDAFKTSLKQSEGRPRFVTNAVSFYLKTTNQCSLKTCLLIFVVIVCQLK